MKKPCPHPFKRKQNIQYTIYVYSFFFILILLRHFDMQIISDDRVNIANHAEWTFRQIFEWRYTFNGRIFTDMAAEFFYFYVPFWLWKAVDSLVYVGIARLLVFYFSEEKLWQTITVCSLILLFPRDYLSSAGYIATTTNYIYTFFAVLIAVLPIVLALKEYPVFSDKKKVVGISILALFGLLYATNHDQYAMVLMGGCFLMLCYLLYEKKIEKGRKDHFRKEVLLCLWATLIISVILYLWQWNMPGHINRMTSTEERDLYLPAFADWSLLKKIYHGYSSTVAVLFFKTNVIMFMFLIVLSLLSVKAILQAKQEMITSKKQYISASIGCFPLILQLLIWALGYKHFVVYYDYAFKMPEIGPFLKNTKYLIALALSVIMILSIVFAIVLLVRNRIRTSIIGMLLFLAAGSREMMGLSPTIYASGYRTFTFFLFAIMVCILLGLQEVVEQLEISYNK